MKLRTLKSGLQQFRPRLQPQVMQADRLRGRAAVTRSERIKVRDLCTCRACSRTTLDGQVDHIVPLHLGGADADENLQWLCSDCHKAKTAREAGERARLSHSAGKETM